MAKVTFIVDPEGNATIEVNDVQGSLCRDLTAGIEKMLGTVQSVRHKPEYDQLAGESAQTERGQF